MGLSEVRTPTRLSSPRSLARSAAQKLPTLLNHHFLKPQLPFSVRRRCAETERRRRRRPGGEMVWVKKPPHRKRRFVCRMTKVLSLQAVAEAKAYLMTHPSSDLRGRCTEPPCGSNATHHHSQTSSVPIVSSGGGGGSGPLYK